MGGFYAVFKGSTRANLVDLNGTVNMYKSDLSWKIAHLIFGQHHKDESEASFGQSLGRLPCSVNIALRFIRVISYSFQEKFNLRIAGIVQGWIS
jgi:hypothetical protein